VISFLILADLDGGKYLVTNFVAISSHVEILP